VKTVDECTSSNEPRIRGGGYVLMTAAYNEEAHIATTIESVLSQTVLPNRWIIVSDGSRDRTDEIVQKYARRHGFIRFLRAGRPPGRSFRCKVMALRAGCVLLEGIDYEFIGNLDADVSVCNTYFEDIIHHFEKRSGLGLTGGFVCEERDGQFQNRTINRVYSVAHAAQLMRRECYESMGGYAVLEYGGEDWHAQTSLRMMGWSVEALPELKVLHHRGTGKGSNLMRHRFRQGRMDYAFGSVGLFEIVKCLRLLPDEPFLIGAIARLLGFFWSWVCREERPVSGKFIAFLRREQNERLLSVLPAIWRSRLRALP